MYTKIWPERERAREPEREREREGRERERTGESFSVVWVEFST